MEVLNKNVGFLSNCEVYELLKQTKEDLTVKLTKKKQQKAQNSAADVDSSNINIDKHLPTIVYESLRYLEKTPCVNQTPDVVKQFLQKLKESSEFKLTKVERLQIINHQPKTAVELQVLIEDAEERFTIEQIDKLLEFINDNLPAETGSDLSGETIDTS